MKRSNKQKFITAFMNLFGSNSSRVLFSSGFFFILMFLFHIYKSICIGDYNWLGAYGALLTIYSLIFTFCHSTYPEFTSDNKPRAKIQSGAWVLLPRDGGAFSDIISEEDADRINHEHSEDVASKYATSVFIYCLSIVGTLLWAYSSIMLK